jgi:hypothetical protein
MATRPTTTLTAKISDIEEPTQDQFSQRRRPDLLQFRLQIDRQTKASYDSFEAAEQAGIAIKTGHPVVQVAIYDVIAGVNRIIELPPK